MQEKAEKYTISQLPKITSYFVQNYDESLQKPKCQPCKLYMGAT